jgi:hypothetical protein
MSQTRDEFKSTVEEFTSNFGTTKTHYTCLRPDIRTYEKEHNCEGCEYFEFCLIPDKRILTEKQRYAKVDK